MEAQFDARAMKMGVPHKEGMIDRMATQLTRLEEEFAQLEAVVQPIRTMESSEPMPEEAPSNRLHEFIIRIESLNRRMSGLTRELHL